jgi:hypothetical protein
MRYLKDEPPPAYAGGFILVRASLGLGLPRLDAKCTYGLLLHPLRQWKQNQEDQGGATSTSLRWRSYCADKKAQTTLPTP